MHLKRTATTKQKKPPVFIGRTVTSSEFQKCLSNARNTIRKRNIRNLQVLIALGLKKKLQIN